ncbi:MAG: hypothetical protein SNJ63_08655 [Sphingomonadaceae bacterium]
MAERDPAEILLWKLTFIRLVGVVLALVGLWVVGAAPIGAASLFAGLGLMLAGAALVAFGARLLRR